VSSSESEVCGEEISRQCERTKSIYLEHLVSFPYLICKLLGASPTTTIESAKGGRGFRTRNNSALENPQERMRCTDMCLATGMQRSR